MSMERCRASDDPREKHIYESHLEKELACDFALQATHGQALHNF